MLPGWLAILTFAAYVAALLALARYGDRASGRLQDPRLRKAIYALSASAYYGSWSFFGSVGLASRRGLDVLPLSIGPIIVFAFFYPVFIRMIRLAKAQNITSIADLIAARYGKAAAVAATITIVATLAYVPFIALQVKIIAQSLAIFVEEQIPRKNNVDGICLVATLLVAPLLAGLTIAIGARRLDATEHQHGLILTVAVEAIVKLVVFLVIGAFVCWGLFDGIGDLTQRVATSPGTSAIIDAKPNLSVWLGLIVTTMAATLVMPLQFHVMIVENQTEADVRTVAWVVPLYIVAVGFFVLPLAAAGLAIFPAGSIDPDFTILALPIHAGQRLMTLLAFIGSLSAAITMVLIATTVIAVMICNDLVMPLLLWAKADRIAAPPILAIRRTAIVAVIALSTLCTVATSGATITMMGLWALVSVAQITPALIFGMIWRRGTARGAIGGSMAGVVVCAYTLGLPALISKTSALLIDGPLTIEALRPTDLFGLDLAPLSQSLLWSLVVNVLVYALLSLSRAPTMNERLQADIFVLKRNPAQTVAFRGPRATISVGDLLATVSRYLSAQTAERVFADYHAKRELDFDRERDADAQLIQYSEHLIASSVGAASSRLVMSLLIERGEMSRGAARRIIDDVAYEIRDSRDLLQHAIDIARDGMAIYDSELRLVAWNRAYRDMFQFPASMLRVGIPMDLLIRFNAERGFYGKGPIEDHVTKRLEALLRPCDGQRLHLETYNRVFEMRSVRLHNGGFFFTYTDATARAQSEEELEAENETLEQRVRERTEQLQSLNLELGRAKADADDANISKSRFLAAASHDILQPLSAARLYTTSLRERLRVRPSGEEALSLANNVDSALEAVEDILSALLEISQLDAGATPTEITAFDIQPILRQLKLEFEPIALEQGLVLTFMPSSLRVMSDRKLLRRLLQNLISNALKYTPTGRVLVGLRRGDESVRISVHDTGLGIPPAKQGVIFREFERLPAGAQIASGAGLGLSIVERLGRVLKHEVGLRSEVDRGSVFTVTLPRATSVLGAFQLQPAASFVARQGSLDGLVVAAIDNELPILRGMQALLQGWDCVVAAGTGLQAIEAALAGRDLVPDVIVADYHVGELDGLAIIAALRQRYGHCPAVLITADRGIIVRDLALAADVRVLNKPLKPAALRALLSQWRLVKTAAE